MARRLSHLTLCALTCGMLLATAAHAFTVPKETAKSNGSGLAGRSFAAREHSLAPDNESLESMRPFAAKALAAGWDGFQASLEGQWNAEIDKRTGHIGYAEGSGIPWIPGRGNQLTLESIKALGHGKVDLATLEAAARAFLPRVADLLGVNPAELVLNQGASGQPASHVWFVDFGIKKGIYLVERAHVVFRVNNGNLIQFGTEYMPAPGAVVPTQKVTKAAARQTLANYIGGFQPADKWIDRGSLHLLPISVVDDSQADGYRPGDGRGLQLVWEFKFRRPGERGTWRGRVNASTGEMVDFHDANMYTAATGGTYKQDHPAAEVVMPLPWADLGGGAYTNSGGIFAGTTGTTTLNGLYVGITDTCGTVSKAADGSGNIALGSSAGTDCTTPGSGGAGNTHAARTQFYNVNRIKEKARGWLPSNTWLQGQLAVSVNLAQTCNAYWDGTKLNFFASGGGCANTGELPGVSLHEFGHGLDSNDGNGDPPENGSGEATGDTSAVLAIHASCVGNGFLASNCGGYGNACTACTGVRDIDWSKHANNAPSTVANFTQPLCPQPSANNPNYVGPCGADASARGNTANKREGHCESLPITESIWDLANRDLPNPGSGSAWATLDRLWYLSRSTATGTFTCNTSGTTWTSNGCSTGSVFRVFRAIDDDDGNLTNGTPHGAAIAAALNRHGIACTTDAGWNTTFAAVTPPAVPSLSVAGGNNAVTLTWSGSSGVYNVYRNETNCSAGFIKVASGVAASPYTDSTVANGITYYYQIVAQPSGNEAAASAPSSCLSVTPSNTGSTPAANFTFTTSNLTANFTDTSTDSGGTINAWSWNFGDAATATTQNPSHTYAAAGTYTVSLQVTDNLAHTSSTSKSVTVSVACTPPAAPTGVSASSSSQTAASVSWSASTGATSYGISRSTTSGGPYTSVGTSASTSFSDSGLTCGTTYYYVVTASNGTCSSGNSAQASATTSACPAIPLQNGTFETGSLAPWTSTGTATVIAGAAHSGSFGAQVGATTATTDSSIVQTFTLPAGSPTLSFWYQVHCPDTITYDWASATIKDNVTSATTTLLANTCTNTGAWAQVTYNAAASAGHSVTLTLANHDDNYASDPTYTWYDDVAVTVACTPPAAPTGVSASSSSQTAASVSWSASTGASSYGISRSTTSGGPYTSVGTSASTSFSDSGLSCGTTYYYVVTASNGSCSSGNSAQASATTAACPSTPTANFTFTTSNLTANFTDTSTDSGGTINAWSWNFGDAATSTAQNPSHTYAAANTYTVTLQVTDNQAHTSSISKSVTVSAACTPPAAPTGVTASSSSQTAASVSWSASTGASSYGISRSTTSGGPYTSVGTSASTAFSDSGLSCGTTYYYVVTASNGSCSSGNSAQASATTSACSSGGIVNGTFETGSLAPWTSTGTATVIAGAKHTGSFGAQVGATTPTTDSSMAQTFTLPSGSPTLSFWYQVHCPDTVTYDWASATLHDNVSGTTTTLLANTCSNTGAWTQVSYLATANAGHSVTLTLANHDDNYASDPTYTWYDDVAVTGGGTCTPPAAPTGVSASSSSQTGASVSWSASTGATSYSISRSTTSGGPYTAVGTSASTSFTDSGLACGTTYYYVVTASNGTCASGNSAQASAATSACTGGGPQNAAYDATLKAPKCGTVGISCDSGASLLLGRGTMSGGAEPNQPNTINNSCADGTSGTFHSDESNDRLKVLTNNGTNFGPGKTVTVQATVWAYSGFTSDHLDLYYAANANSPTWVLIGTLTPTAAGAQTLSGTYTLPAGSLQAVRANFRYTGSASSCSTGSYDDHDDLVFAVGP